jgi:c-di-AMP phosphodiesterase-like protein
MEKLTIQTQLSLDDFTKASYHLLYRKLLVKLLTGFGIYILIIDAFTFFTEGQFDWYRIFVGLFLIIGFPLQVKLTAKRNYKSNRRMGERITYEFDKELIQLTGESFNSKMTWGKIYRVTENKDYFLIWQNRQVANIIPKRDLNKNEIQTFKEIVNHQKGIRNKLRK